jgi:hypothetical protein
MEMGQVMGGLPAPQPAPHSAPYPVAYPVAYPAAHRGVNYGRVLLHIGVFQFAINVVAFGIGFLLAALLYVAGQSTTSEGARLLFFLVVLAFGTLSLIIGFLIIGLRVERSIRWLHMTYVALGLAVTTVLINWWAGIFHPANAADFVVPVIVALIQTFFGMGVGGGLSFLIGGRQDAPAPAPMGQPYPYGAHPSIPLYPPQPGQQAYPPPYPPQLRPPYYPPNLGAPQYPPQQGTPQYPPNAGQPPRYPPQYPPQQGAPQPPPQYPPQQPPAGEQGGNKQ